MEDSENSAWKVSIETRKNYGKVDGNFNAVIFLWFGELIGNGFEMWVHFWDDS